MSSYEFVLIAWYRKGRYSETKVSGVEVVSELVVFHGIDVAEAQQRVEAAETDLITLQAGRFSYVPRRETWGQDPTLIGRELMRK